MVFDGGKDFICQKHDARWEYATGALNNNNNDNHHQQQIFSNSQRFDSVTPETIAGGGGGSGGASDVAVFVTDTSGKMDAAGTGLISSPDIIRISEKDRMESEGASDDANSLSEIVVRPSLSGSDDGSGGNGGKDTPGIISGCSRLSLISVLKSKSTAYIQESWRTILSQMGLPFFVAGLGMVCAGILLDTVLIWKVFIELPELVILVTPFLGLKGNLEMTLASRLSTHSNIGSLDDPEKRWKICTGNLLLDQLQALVCGLVACFIAIVTGYVSDRKLILSHVLLLTSASMITASLVSILLGSTMVGVILISRRFNLNPDNVATPVAGSLGDIVTLGMLSYLASAIWEGMALWGGLPYVIIAFYLCVIPVCAWKTYKNEYTKEVVIHGWLPVIISVLISTGGGVLLDTATKHEQFKGLALYQPVINGIGGNLVSVQASRISSQLHRECVRGTLPNSSPVCESPLTVFFKKGGHAMSARLLLIMAIPGHFIFATATHYMSPSEDSQYNPLFLTFYIGAAICQVIILLYLAKLLTNLCWRHKMDPDTSTIPYLTAMGDLFGSSLLLGAFQLIYLLR